MRGREEDAAGGFELADDVAGGRSAHDAVDAKDEFLDAVRGANLDNELHDLWVVVATVAANDEEGILSALGDGEQDGGDEGLGVVWLLEDFDLFAQTRAGARVSASVMEGVPGVGRGRETYVPGFWSVKGWRVMFLVEAMMTSRSRRFGG